MLVQIKPLRKTKAMLKFSMVGCNVRPIAKLVALKQFKNVLHEN